MKKRLGSRQTSMVAGAVFVFLSGGLLACSSEQTKAQTQPPQQKQQPGNLPGNQPGVAGGGPGAEQAQSPGSPAPGEAPAMAPAMEHEKLGIVSETRTTSRIPMEKTVIRGQEIPTITETRVGADINRMTAPDFKALGLSGDLSQSIVQYRAAHGPFKTVKDLGRVPSMDQGWLADNQDRLAVAPNVATG